MRHRHLLLVPILLAASLAGCSTSPSGPSHHEAKVLYLEHVDNYAYRYHLHHPHPHPDIWADMMKATHINGCKPTSTPKTFKCSGYTESNNGNKQIINRATFKVIQVGNNRWKTLGSGGY
ncbi:hypothetical protein A4U49_09530 [Acidithiobacillus ferrivorans]|uniref:hypothetical protein n=1 Tax=Acidithiobacillus ferrivorans TaxID=160808 RepID=UPI0008941497|nr:hypothetical protein [Acidithiobacillus ferrivorans]OFA15994.1 hypothetical protein A4U49_09530 [Acidithiobacillus ferrivorans]